MFDREFTKSLIIRDFDHVLENPFPIRHIIIKKIAENRHAWPIA